MFKEELTIKNNIGEKTIQRGQIWFANIPEFKKERTRIQQGRRPVVIISNKMANKYSPVVTVVVLTTRMDKHNIPTHVLLGKECRLRANSLALCEMILTLDKDDLLFQIGNVPKEKMILINKAKDLQTQDEFDETYIQKLIHEIKKAKELFLKYKDDFLKQLMINTVDELQDYCNNYNIDYTIYLGGNDVDNMPLRYAV